MTRIRVTELAPMVEAVQEVRRLNPQASFKPVFDEWSHVVLSAKAELRAAEAAVVSGKLPQKFADESHALKAAKLVLKVAQTIEPDRLLDLIAGMHLLRKANPGRFLATPSDEDATFKMGLIFVVRREGRIETYMSKASSSSIFYADIHRDVRRRLYDQLHRAFGAAGERLAMVEVKRRVDEVARSLAMKMTLEALV